MGDSFYFFSCGDEPIIAGAFSGSSAQVGAGSFASNGSAPNDRSSEGSGRLLALESGCLVAHLVGQDLSSSDHSFYSVES